MTLQDPLNRLVEQQRYENMRIPSEVATVLIEISIIIKSNKSELETYIKNNFIRIEDFESKVTEIIKSKSSINKVLKPLKNFWNWIFGLFICVLGGTIKIYFKEIVEWINNFF
jgi:hypothetical protein